MALLKRKSKKTEAAAEKTEAVAVVSKGTAKAVIIAPRVTEKAAVSQSHNKYIFLVEKSATKNQVKQAIVAEYKVKPTSVNLINVQGKRKRAKVGMGKRGDFKKAIVTLPHGQTITVHEGV